MSQVRVHNFSISLDGFGTGAGITFEAPFGHAGERLHEWLFATRYWRSMVGESGGSAGVDHSFADRHGAGFGAEIMGRGKFGVQTGPWTDVGTDDEWRGWWGPNPPFHSPVFVLTHHPRPPIEMEGGTVFHFVNATPQEALDLAGRRPATSTYASAVAPPSSATSSPPASSTRSMPSRYRSSSAAAFACGTASRPSKTATRSRPSPRRPASPTSPSPADSHLWEVFAGDADALVRAEHL